jgi:hypothetical protein
MITWIDAGFWPEVASRLAQGRMTAADPNQPVANFKQ